MNELPTICPKCQGKMVQGFTVEMTSGTAEVERWAEGIPQKTWIGGVNVPIMGRIPIASFRCEACGYLESYARKEFLPK